MITFQNKNQLIFESEDRYGTFQVRAHKDCSQIQVETGINGNHFHSEVYFNVNLTEIIAIRDMLNLIIDHKQL